MPTPKIKPFRIGVQRATTGEFKPVATVGVASDGGLWVAPSAVAEFGWTYGRVNERGEGVSEHVVVDQRPKLHYHRSGIVRVTLSGTRLPLREVRFRPLVKIKRAQILSVSSVRPWELTSDEMRPGDVSSIDLQWPSRVGFIFSVVAPRRRRTHASQSSQSSQSSALGMLGGDDHHFTLDPSAHGVRSLYVCDLIRSFRVFDEDELPGTTVTAIAWTGDGERADAFALWTSSMRNPVATVHDEAALRTRRSLARGGFPRPREMTYAEKADQLRELRAAGLDDVPLDVPFDLM